MPFDQHLGASGARQLTLAREVGKGYVPVTAVAPEYKVLHPPRQTVLCKWVDTLIPREGAWPAPSERGVPQYIDNSAACSGTLRRMLIDAVDDADSRAITACGEGFASCSAETRVEVLKQMEAERPADFALLLELTFEGYYRDRSVAHVVEDRTGFRVAGPLAGIRDEPFQEQLLADVVTREKHYRDVAEVNA